MKYVVSGGCGFIGSHIVDSLIARGDEVVILDNMSTGKKENRNPKAEFHEIDIALIHPHDGYGLEYFRGVDGVFHVGASARIQPSFSDPDLYFRSNVIGTRNILMCARASGAKRVVYSASSSAYGDTELPAKETSKIASQSLNPYASTKRMGEMLMKDLGIMTGGPETVCLRYFNVYGPRQNTDMDGPYPTVIGLFLGLHAKGKPLTIVPDGFQKRDFTWVGDIVQANLKAMSSMLVGKAEIINVGYGTNHSVWDVAKMILGKSLETSHLELLESKECVYAPERSGEARATLSDISKAKGLLGYVPTVSLSEGLKKLKGEST